MCKINGVKLTEMREKAGMSQNALAKKLKDMTIEKLSNKFDLQVFAEYL